jgi:homoserine/homoserine lactone efflux protein
VVEWLGVGYRAYLGLMAIFGRPSSITPSSLSSADKPAWKIWFSGLTLRLANPKALIFFVAIQPQFVNPIGNLPLQMIWLAASSMIPELLILACYGVLAGRMQAVATRPGYGRTTHPIAGGLMVGVASLVATVRA